jgi:putative flippase GtrA
VGLAYLPVAQLWRFFGVGVVNTLFGYALYAMLITAGLKMFVAQIVATIIAVAFNYLSYSRFVFHGAPRSRLRFLLSYGLNYLISLVALALSAIILPSPYVAGLLATLVTAIINFVVLRRYVFASRLDKSGIRETQPQRLVTVSEKINHASCG